MRPVTNASIAEPRAVAHKKMSKKENNERGIGLIQVYTGNGKGKTTAALGTAIRSVAVGKRVVWVAFDKGGESHYSERPLIRERLPEMDFFVTGLDRIDPVTGTFRFGVTEDDRKEGERGLAKVREIFMEAKQDLIILDEINSSVALGIVKEKDLLILLEQKPAHTEIILTGRDAPTSLLERADLITDMRIVKHYFYQGIRAREGLDY